MKTDMYFMKIMTTASPYFQIVRGHWRYKDAVMQKAEELKQDATVQQIVIKKRDNSRQIPTNFYKWDQAGFEVIYIRR